MLTHPPPVQFSQFLSDCREKEGIEKTGLTFWAVNKCTRFQLIIIAIWGGCLHYSLVTNWFTVVSPAV